MGLRCFWWGSRTSVAPSDAKEPRTSTRPRISAYAPELSRGGCGAAFSGRDKILDDGSSELLALGESPTRGSMIAWPWRGRSFPSAARYRAPASRFLSVFRRAALRLQLLESDLKAVVETTAAEDTQGDLPRVSDDFDGDVDEGEAEALPVPATGLGGQRQQ